MSNKYLPKLSSEDGYASFVITLVTIIVISLIVVAFATSSRLEQKNSLANDLATQAYYAAESGINDAFKVISTSLNQGAPLSTLTTNGNCATGSPYISGTSNYLDSGGQVKYDCLIVNPSPSSLMYQDLTPGAAQVIELSNADGLNMNTITISWQYDQSEVNGSPLSFSNCPTPAASGAKLPTLNLTGAGSFDPADCGAGVLQLDIIGDKTLSANPNTLANSVFFEPQANSGSASDSPSGVSRDKVYYVSCNATPLNGDDYACSQTLNVAGESTYYLRLQSFYQAANVAITAADANGPVGFSNAQILIDSTGNASGQLKREVERLCYGNYCGNAAASGAIQSDNCVNKKFTVYPGDTTVTPPAPANC